MMMVMTIDCLFLSNGKCSFPCHIKNGKFMCCMDCDESGVCDYSCNKDTHLRVKVFETLKNMRSKKRA